MLKNSELKLKDVIDIKRGKKLGYIDDIDIEVENGQVKAFVVPAHQNRLFNFFLKKNDQIIHWSEIRKIGEDVILVSWTKIRFKINFICVILGKETWRYWRTGRNEMSLL